MKRTKILATYGPAIASERMLTKLVDAGVNAFRVNCSHGMAEDFSEAVRLIRKATNKSRFPVGILFDISGPKLRLDRFTGDFPAKAGEKITLTTGRSNLAKREIAVNHPGIIASIKPGERIFIDDGVIGLVAEQVSNGRALLRLLNAGTLLPGKGINLPDSDIQIPTIGAKDKQDIATAVTCGADFIALSFVRSASDVEQVRKLVTRSGGSQKLIAKLEKREAINALEDVMDVSDGVMIARGDLGVELPPEQLPNLQKRIVELANLHRQPVIVATQMLESMRFSPRPTRAEVNDVASAVFDHADAVMLSAETATGTYPLETVKMMAAVIESSEQRREATTGPRVRMLTDRIEPYLVSQMVGSVSDDSVIKMIFAFTTSGFTAELISNLFPRQPIAALVSDKKVMRQLSLIRSVLPIYVEQPGSFDALTKIVNRVSRQYQLATKGQHVIITGGAPFGTTMGTNFLMIHEVE
ncbi:MAG: pyruvate kinase [candidate division Zixibacteria bacterium]|nr:pyruvate kinase [candidate division Zixibacteria bacterium]